MSGQKQEKNTKRRAFVLGLFIVILALAGTVSIVFHAIDLFKSLNDDSDAYAEYEAYIMPVVMTDTDPFDDISLADSSQLIDAAVCALLENGDTGKYELFDGEPAGLLVAQKDIEKYCGKLFGSGSISHSGVTTPLFGAVYNAENMAYIIPVTGIDPIYTPKIFSVESKGDSKILTVGYIGGSEWALLDEEEKYTAPEPSKYMKITLRSSADSYYIVSISAIDGEIK